MAFPSVKSLLFQRWFLLTLGVVMIAGFCGSDWLLPLANRVGLRHAIVAGVLFVMALPLEAKAMWQTVRQPAAPVLAIAMNSLLLPLVTWGVGATLDNGLLSHDLVHGLMVAAATPCTLASASVWTRRAGGNDSAAIMVTVVTNATCFLVTPFWLLQMTGKVASIDVSSMVVKLGLVVVLPMALAQLLRLARPLGRWSTHHAKRLSVIAQLGVLTMVFFGSIQTGQRFTANAAPGFEIVVLILSVVGIHTAMLVLGVTLARWLGMEPRDQIAVGFAGSQKTLMVGLQVAMDLGLNIVPMVAYHISQLLVDTFIADRWRRRME